MSQFLTQFAGANPTYPSIQFTEWVDDLIPIPGVTGVPDQATNPAQCATYLTGLQTLTVASGFQRPMLRIADANLEVMAEVQGEISCSVEELMDDTGKCVLTILYDNWVTDWVLNQTQPIADLNLLIDPMPTKQDWRSRWGGKITEMHIKRDERGVYSVELTALSFREHAKRLLVAANPIFPPEVQLPRMWVMPGPVRTICAITSFINLARLFMPGWSTITNVFNPAGWINPLNPDAALNVLPTEWPIQVAFIDPALDTSRWSALGSTWNNWHDAYKDLLTDAGVVMRVYTYLTTDFDSPNTELANILTVVPELLSDITGITSAQLDQDLDALVSPLRNCCVFAFENKSGVIGPTGTAADGLTDTIAVTLDDLITPIVIDVRTGNAYDPGNILNGEEVYEASGIGQTQLLEQLLDVAPQPPKVIWWDSPYNGLLNTNLAYHKGATKTIMTGSKSPVIVNEAQTFAIRYALSELSAVISDQIGQTYQTPGAPGLDSLYQGQLDNVLLAWERFTDPVRALYSGDVAWQEHFEKGSGTAYTLSSILTLRDGDWKTRVWAAFQATPTNGFPWVVNSDYYLGDRVGFEQNGIIYVDNVYGISYDWEYRKAMQMKVKIGEDKMKADPFGAAFKTMAVMYGLVGELLGEGTIFDGGT